MVHYKAPRSDRDLAIKEENHYEVDPSLKVDDDIYENTDFDHPFDPKEGVVHTPIYQNTSFDEKTQVTQKTQAPQKTQASPLKQYPKLVVGGNLSKPALDKKKDLHSTVSAPGSDKKKDPHSKPVQEKKEKRKAYPKIAIPDIPTAAKKVSPSEQDEYINPEEFIIEQDKPQGWNLKLVFMLHSHLSLFLFSS